MALDDLVIYSVFIGAELESDIHFALSNHPDSQTRKKQLIEATKLTYKMPLWSVTLRDLDLESTVYGV